MMKKLLDMSVLLREYLAMKGRREFHSPESIPLSLFLSSIEGSATLYQFPTRTLQRKIVKTRLRSGSGEGREVREGEIVCKMERVAAWNP